MSEKVLLLVIAVCLGFVGGIMQKIVWSFFNQVKGKENMSSTKCSSHEECLMRLNVCEKNTNKAQRDYVELSTSFKDHARYIERRLDQGQDNFKMIKEDIKKMCNTLTVIATRIEERNKQINN